MPGILFIIQKEARSHLFLPCSTGGAALAGGDAGGPVCAVMIKQCAACNEFCAFCPVNKTVIMSGLFTSRKLLLEGTLCWQ